MGRRARHVIVIAGASGSSKTELIGKMSRPPHDAFITGVLKQLDCNTHQRLKRSTVGRMQRLMDPVNFKKRKTRKLKHCLLLHIDLTSINHNSNLKLLNQISTRIKRLDVINLYTSPKEWRQRIIDRLHTENEPSTRAALITLSAKFSISLSNFLHHREYTRRLKALEITTLKTVAWSTHLKKKFQQLFYLIERLTSPNNNFRTSGLFNLDQEGTKRMEV